MRFWYDPVTVNRESGDNEVTARVVARVGRHPQMMILSQENCLSTDVLLHLRRMGGVAFFGVKAHIFGIGAFIFFVSYSFFFRQ